MADGMIDKLYINIETKVTGSTKKIDNLTTSLRELSIVCRTLETPITNVSRRINDLAFSIRNVPNAKKLEKFVGSMQTAQEQLSDGAISQSVEETTGAVEEAEEETKSFSDVIKNFGGALKGAFPKLTTFAKLVKKIALLKFVRSIIAQITKGFREGVNAVYQYSKETQNFSGSFAQRMDELATARNYLQNSIGAAVSPLLSILIPAIDKAIDKFVDLLNIANQVFARLNGQNYWTKAKKVPMEYAEATKKATKENEKLKKSLLGFDEINKLDDPTSKSSSTSGSGTDYSIQFTTEKMTQEQMEKLDKLATKLKWVIAIAGGLYAAFKFAKIIKAISDITGGFGTIKTVLSWIGLKLSNLWAWISPKLTWISTKVTWLIDKLNGNAIAISGGGAIGLLIAAAGVLAEILFNWDTWTDLVEGWVTDQNYFETFKYGWNQLWQDVLGEKTFQKAKGFFDRIGTALGNGLWNGWETFVNWIWNTRQRIKDILAKIFKIDIHFSSSGVSHGVGSGARQFADGGFPTQGQMFIANESGAELVGQIGGRTAVANTNEITQGIASGVASAQAPQIALLSEQNKLLRALLDKESTTKVSVTDIVNGMQRKNRRDGITTIAVGG